MIYYWTLVRNLSKIYVVRNISMYYTLQIQSFHTPKIELADVRPPQPSHCCPPWPGNNLRPNQAEAATFNGFNIENDVCSMEKCAKPHGFPWVLTGTLPRTMTLMNCVFFYETRNQGCVDVLLNPIVSNQNMEPKMNTSNTICNIPQYYT